MTVRTTDGPCEALTYQMRPGYTFTPPVPDYWHLVAKGYKDWGIDWQTLPARPS